MPLYPHEVGDRLLVWTQDKKDGPVNKVAVISAHGGDAKINIMAAHTPVDLVFYSPHGVTAKDSVGSFGDSRVVEVVYGALKYDQVGGEVLRSDHSQDYILSKYQLAKHAFIAGPRNQVGEDYEFIAHLDEIPQKYIDQAVANLGVAKAELPAIRERGERSMAEKILEDAHENLRWALAAFGGKGSKVRMDVITIRHRLLHSSDILLSELIRDLQKHKYGYDTLHCFFCRGAA